MSEEEIVGLIVSPETDPDLWLETCADIWNTCYGSISIEGNTIRFATGGWSENEAIIEIMSRNKILWFQTWESSHRGGKYVFKFKNQRRGS